MATKREVLAQALSGRGCLGKAADDEPVFVLRAQDRYAARCVDDWADYAGCGGCSPEKVAEARALAKKMRAWPTKKVPD
jgi:hypothetical protein